MKKSDPPIIVEEAFDQPLNSVWRAITEPISMRKWFFPQIVSFQAIEGFETSFKVDVENRSFTHLWRIMEVIPNQKIKYQWRYDEYPGNSFVTFELIEKGDKVNLKLTTKVLKDFPQEIPEFKRESCIGGWEYFIKNSLKNYLDLLE